MVIRRGFRYRIYPTPDQDARLRQWEDALRVLWNLAHEQRLAYLNRHAKMPSAFDQMRELTALRADVPWLADVPGMSPRRFSWILTSRGNGASGD